VLGPAAALFQRSAATDAVAGFAAGDAVAWVAAPDERLDVRLLWAEPLVADAPGKGGGKDAVRALPVASQWAARKRSTGNGGRCRATH
jgi:hypothetical protein